LNTTAIDSVEYRNDFFSIVIGEAPGHGPGTYLFCSAINISRFDPLCWGKAGICSNPAFKGLQLLRADVSAFAMKRGIVTRNSELAPCDRTGYGDGWYRENALLIEQASSGDIREILEFSVTDLVRTVLTACIPDSKVPAGFLEPEAMQRFLESLSVRNYKEAAPPPIAKAQPV
jgi:hypothetical protein